MWDQIASLFSGIEEEDTVSLKEEQIKIAVAALLVHATFIDGIAAENEMQSLKHLLKKQYDLSSEEMVELLAHAHKEEKEATDLYRFTRVLKEHLDQDGRQNIVEMLWEIVLADDQLHEFESNLVWRISELLAVSSRDRIALKQKVEARKVSTKSD